MGTKFRQAAEYRPVGSEHLPSHVCRQMWPSSRRTCGSSAADRVLPHVGPRCRASGIAAEIGPVAVPAVLLVERCHHCQHEPRPMPSPECRIGPNMTSTSRPASLGHNAATPPSASTASAHSGNTRTTPVGSNTPLPRSTPQQCVLNRSAALADRSAHRHRFARAESGTRLSERHGVRAFSSIGRAADF